MMNILIVLFLKICPYKYSYCFYIILSCKSYGFFLEKKDIKILFVLTCMYSCIVHKTSPIQYEEASLSGIPPSFLYPIKIWSLYCISQKKKQISFLPLNKIKNITISSLKSMDGP